MADVTFYSQAGADAKFALKAGQLDRGAVESIVSETPPRTHEHDASEINGVLPAERVNLAGYAKMSDIPDTSTFVDDTELNNKGFVTSSDLSTYATRAFVTDEIAGAQLGGEGVSDESVAAVVPTGATAQAIASLVGVVVRDTDAEATTLAGQWGVAGLVIDEVVGGAVEPPADVTAPTITAPAWPSLTVGAAIGPLVLSADETVTWSMSGALPAGLSWNAASGTVSGTPTTAGTGSVTFTGTDAASNAAQVSWSWLVAAPPAPDARTVLFSERFSSHDETQEQLTSRSPDNYAGGTITTPPTAGAFAQATAGTLATRTTPGMVGVHAVGEGLCLGAQLTAGVDEALRYALPAEPRHAEFTVTSPPAVTNVVVMLHEAGVGTYAWAQVNTGTLRAAARSGYGTAQTSSGVPFAQGDRIRVEAVLVGADTEVTATNLTTGEVTAVTLAGADVTATSRLTIQFPTQFGKGSIDELIVFEGGAA